MHSGYALPLALLVVAVSVPLSAQGLATGTETAAPRLFDPKAEEQRADKASSNAKQAQIQIALHRGALDQDRVRLASLAGSVASKEIVSLRAEADHIVGLFESANVCVSNWLTFSAWLADKKNRWLERAASIPEKRDMLAGEVATAFDEEMTVTQLKIDRCKADRALAKERAFNLAPRIQERLFKIDFEDTLKKIRIMAGSE